MRTRTCHVVSFQEASRIPTLPSDDADSASTVESYEMAERKGNPGKLNILDRDFHWSQSSMQSLLNNLNCLSYASVGPLSQWLPKITT